MEITPEVQAQLDEQKANCIFCKIISGEMEGKKVYDDELVYGVLDINPWTKGHLLIMPKEHYPIMPFLPVKTFDHIFGILPKMVEAVKKAIVCTATNVMIANGAVAGQQSPHFLFHIIPRDSGDGIFNFAMENESVTEQKTFDMLSHNIPMMIKNHFTKNAINLYAENFDKATIYSDELLSVRSLNKVCGGSLQITLNSNTKFEDLSYFDSAYLFRVASLCATAQFEGMGAAGTNIILKEGICDDNSNGQLSINLFPRNDGDGLDFSLKPMEEKPDLDDVASSIKSEAIVVEHFGKEYLKEKEVELNNFNFDSNEENVEHDDEKKKEIQNAIDSIRNG